MHMYAYAYYASYLNFRILLLEKIAGELNQVSHFPLIQSTT